MDFPSKKTGRLAFFALQLALAAACLVLSGAGMGVHWPQTVTGSTEKETSTSISTTWGLLQTRKFNLDINVENDKAWMEAMQVMYNSQYKPRDGRLFWPYNPSATDFESLVGDVETGEWEIPVDLATAQTVIRRVVADTATPWALGVWDTRSISTEFSGWTGRRERIWTTKWRELLPADGGVRHLHLDLSMLRPRSSAGLQATMKLKVRTASPLQAVYCPQTALHLDRIDGYAMEGSFQVPAHSMSGLDLYFMEGETWLSPHMLFHTTDSRTGYVLARIQAPEPETGKGEEETERADRIPICLVLDCSASMRGDKLDLAQEVTLSVLEQLGKDHEIVIVAADKPPRLLGTSKDYRSAWGHDRLMGALRSLRPGSNGSQTRALELAVSAAGSEQVTVLWLTDGIMKKVPFADARLGKKVAVHAVGVGRRVNVELLEKTAARLGGEVRFLMPGDDPTAKLEDLFSRLGAATPLVREASLKPVGASIQPEEALRVDDLFEGGHGVMVARYRRHDDQAWLELDGLGPEGKILVKSQGRFPVTPVANPWLERLWARRRLGQLYDGIWRGGRNPVLSSEAASLYLDHGITNLYADSRWPPLTDIAKSGSTTWLERRRRHSQYDAHLKVHFEGNRFVPRADDIYAVGIANAEGEEAIQATRTIGELKRAERLPEPSDNLLTGFGKPKRLNGDTWMDVGTESATPWKVAFGSTTYETLFDLPGLAENLACGSRVRFRTGQTLYDIWWEYIEPEPESVTGMEPVQTGQPEVLPGMKFDKRDRDQR